ncbi:unnamed protein product [Mytilus coruscus]|uniref:Integrase core domain-containing protein n=1 Tax=Mytilus coruscus TaxID=42192 RepID=A0A6J8AIG4_MYTCO|nr:unnamed protein product [Mytilus coruscus]
MSKLKLKRYNNESQLPHILDKIVHLREQGYSEVGYRSMWRILNTYKNCRIRATQETVRFALNALDRSSVVRRLNRRLTRRRYCNKGPNFCIHIDGYDKLKPYGISIHGAIDGFSRKILWLSASHSNKNPRFVAFDYVHYLKTIKGVPRMVRADAGTENVDIKYIQLALRSFHNDDVAGCI